MTKTLFTNRAGLVEAVRQLARRLDRELTGDQERCRSCSLPIKALPVHGRDLWVTARDEDSICQEPGGEAALHHTPGWVDQSKAHQLTRELIEAVKQL